MRDLPATTGGGQAILLSRSTLEGLLATLTAGAAGTVAIEVDEDGVVVRHAEVETEVAQVPGAFPDYRRLLEAAAPVVGSLGLDRAALRAGVEAAAGPGLVGAGCVVRLVPGPAGLTLRGNEEANEPVTVAATATGGPVALALDARYLLDGLDSFPGAARIVLDLTGPIWPVTLRAEGTDAVYVLMPVLTDDPVGATA